MLVMADFFKDTKVQLLACIAVLKGGMIIFTLG